MPDHILAYILLAAVVAAWYGIAMRRPPASLVCWHCGDCIQIPRGWPTPCPTCGHYLLG